MIQENIYDENRMLPKNSMNRIKAAMEKYAKSVFGDKYGTKNDKLTSMYFPDGEDEVYNNVDIATGPFAISNSKLSDNQTLIINFTSALGCPSIADCPITQKACYAVAGENRLKDTRRKHLIMQNLVTHANARDLLDGLFDIAELYVIEAKEHTRKPIKYIRYNEVGDFMNQQMLVKAARFSKKMRDEYGIISMAYTAKKGIDPSQEVDGEPIDMIIAINRSRNDIPHSANALDRNFFGVEMNNFSTNPNVNLENAYSDVDYVEDKDLNHLKVEQPINDRHGNPSIPVLNVGSWDGGSGYYYVCPCSFWRYNKDKARKKYLVSHGYIKEGDELPQTSQGLSNFLKKLGLKDKELKELNSILNKIKSPCGIQCSVCHDISGGVTKDGKKNIKKYAILAATHGATAGNYNAEYATAKRNGEDDVEYAPGNKHGMVKKYINKYNSDAPIRQDLFQRSADNQKEIEQRKNEFKNEMKRFFGDVI
jgi:hypothetical protein